MVSPLKPLQEKLWLQAEGTDALTKLQTEPQVLFECMTWEPWVHHMGPTGTVQLHHMGAELNRVNQQKWALPGVLEFRSPV